MAGRILVVSGNVVEALDPTGKIAWSYSIPDGELFPLVAAGDVIAVPSLSRGTQRLTGLRPSSGAVQWRVSSPAGGASWLWAAADSGRIVVLSNTPSPRLEAYDTDGRAAWTVTASAAIDQLQEGRTPIAVGSGSVVVATTSGLEAHDLSTGATTWAGRGGMAIAGPPTIVGDTALVDVGQYSSKLAGYSLATGTPTLSHSFAGDLIWYAVDGETLYTDETEPGAADFLGAYTLPALHQLWREPMGGLNLVGFGDFLPLAGGILVVHGIRGGSQLAFRFFGPPSVRSWSMPIPRSTVSALSETGGELSGFVPTGGGVLVSTVDGGLFAFGPAG